MLLIIFAGRISVIAWVGRPNCVQKFFFWLSAGSKLLAELADIGPTPCEYVTLAHSNPRRRLYITHRDIARRGKQGERGETSLHGSSPHWLTLNIVTPSLASFRNISLARIVTRATSAGPRSLATTRVASKLASWAISDNTTHRDRRSERETIKGRNCHLNKERQTIEKNKKWKQ